MPLTAVFLIFNQDTYINYTVSHEAKLTIYAILFINTIFVPVTIMAYLMRKKMISSLLLTHRQERWFPLIMISFFYFFTYYLIRQIHLPSQLVYNMIFGAIFCLVMLILLNGFIKISAHTTGMGGVTGAIIAFSVIMKINLMPIIIPLILLAGIIGSSRLKLNAHKPQEIYAGFVLGFGCEFCSLIYNLG